MNTKGAELVEKWSHPEIGSIPGPRELFGAWDPKARAPDSRRDRSGTIDAPDTDGGTLHALGTILNGVLLDKKQYDLLFIGEVPYVPDKDSGDSKDAAAEQLIYEHLIAYIETQLRRSPEWKPTTLAWFQHTTTHGEDAPNLTGNHFVFVTASSAGMDDDTIHLQVIDSYSSNSDSRTEGIVSQSARVWDSLISVDETKEFIGTRPWFHRILGVDTGRLIHRKTVSADHHYPISQRNVTCGLWAASAAFHLVTETISSGAPCNPQAWYERYQPFAQAADLRRTRFWGEDDRWTAVFRYCVAALITASYETKGSALLGPSSKLVLLNPPSHLFSSSEKWEWTRLMYGQPMPRTPDQLGDKPIATESKVRNVRYLYVRRAPNGVTLQVFFEKDATDEDSVNLVTAADWAAPATDWKLTAKRVKTHVAGIDVATETLVQIVPVASDGDGPPNGIWVDAKDALNPTGALENHAAQYVGIMGERMIVAKLCRLVTTCPESIDALLGDIDKKEVEHARALVGRDAMDTDRRWWHRCADVAANVGYLAVIASVAVGVGSVLANLDNFPAVLQPSLNHAVPIPSRTPLPQSTIDQIITQTTPIQGLAPTLAQAAQHGPSTKTSILGNSVDYDRLPSQGPEEQYEPHRNGSNGAEDAASSPSDTSATAKQRQPDAPHSRRQKRQDARKRASARRAFEEWQIVQRQFARCNWPKIPRLQAAQDAQAALIAELTAKAAELNAKAAELDKKATELDAREAALQQETQLQLYDKWQDELYRVALELSAVFQQLSIMYNPMGVVVKTLPIFNPRSKAPLTATMTNLVPKILRDYPALLAVPAITKTLVTEAARVAIQASPDAPRTVQSGLGLFGVPDYSTEFGTAQPGQQRTDRDTAHQNYLRVAYLAQTGHLFEDEVVKEQVGIVLNAGAALQQVYSRKIRVTTVDAMLVLLSEHCHNLQVKVPRVMEAHQDNFDQDAWMKRFEDSHRGQTDVLKYPTTAYDWARQTGSVGTPHDTAAVLHFLETMAEKDPIADQVASNLKDPAFMHSVRARIDAQTRDTTFKRHELVKVHTNQEIANVQADYMVATRTSDGNADRFAAASLAAYADLKRTNPSQSIYTGEPVMLNNLAQHAMGAAMAPAAIAAGVVAADDLLSHNNAIPILDPTASAEREAQLRAATGQLPKGTVSATNSRDGLLKDAATAAGTFAAGQAWGNLDPSYKLAAAHVATSIVKGAATLVYHNPVSTVAGAAAYAVYQKWDDIANGVHRVLNRDTYEAFEALVQDNEQLAAAGLGVLESTEAKRITDAAEVRKAATAALRARITQLRDDGFKQFEDAFKGDADNPSFDQFLKDGAKGKPLDISATTLPDIIGVIRAPHQSTPESNAARKVLDAIEQNYARQPVGIPAMVRPDPQNGMARIDAAHSPFNALRGTDFRYIGGVTMYPSSPFETPLSQAPRIAAPNASPTKPVKPVPQLVTVPHIEANSNKGTVVGELRQVDRMFDVSTALPVRTRQPITQSDQEKKLEEHRSLDIRPPPTAGRPATPPTPIHITVVPVNITHESPEWNQVLSGSAALAAAIREVHQLTGVPCVVESRLYESFGPASAPPPHSDDTTHDFTLVCSKNVSIANIPLPSNLIWVDLTRKQSDHAAFSEPFIRALTSLTQRLVSRRLAQCSHSIEDIADNLVDIAHGIHNAGSQTSLYPAE
jgi:hypothetical protein